MSEEHTIELSEPWPDGEMRDGEFVAQNHHVEFSDGPADGVWRIIGISEDRLTLTVVGCPDLDRTA